MQDYQAPADLLKERIIMVTGAGSGIGRAAAKAYAAHGATVILVGRTVSKLESVYDEIEAAGHPKPAIVPLNFEGAAVKEYEELAMTIEEAYDLFRNIPSIKRRLQTLIDVGLGYISLGQPATTLSGGEAQRVKLATELSKIATGRTLYILDEPTTGLHFHDVARLLEVLERLTASGNTVVTIEHNLDVIKTADWIIDLGPEGGSGGGQIIAEGTPEHVAEEAGSHTGRYLKGVLAQNRK